MLIGIDQRSFRWIADDNSRPSFRGVDRETVDEYLARGGKIKKCPPMVPTKVDYLLARPTHPESEYGQHLRGVL
jgi:hypothetical protein